MSLLSSPGSTATFDGPLVTSGTVETLVGRQCRAGSRPGAGSVRSVVPDPAGGLFFSSGPPGEGWIVKAVNGTRSFNMLRIPGPELPERGRSKAFRRFGDVLLPDGQGGLLGAREGRVFHLAAPAQVNDWVPVAGKPPSATDSSAGGGDGGPADQATFAGITAMASDESGNLFIADSAASGWSIRFINRSAQQLVLYPGTPTETAVSPGHIQTVAVAGARSGAGGRGVSLEAEGRATALETTREGLYVASSGSGRRSRPEIFVVNLGGAAHSVHGKTVEPVTALLLTRSEGSPSGDRTSSPAPQNFGPVPGLGADTAGNLYLADERNHRVLRLDPQGELSVFAGTGRPGFSGNENPAARARLNRPFDVVAAPAGLVFISDRGNGQIRSVDQRGVIRAASGTGLWPFWVCQHPLGPQLGIREPRLDPVAIVAGPSGDVFFSSTGKRVPEIRRITATGRVSAPVGSRVVCPVKGPCPRSGPGGRGPAALSNPSQLAAVSGGLYILDQGNNRILFANLLEEERRVHGITAPPRSLVAVAGDGKIGNKGDGGPALAARFAQPGGIAVSRGRLVIADTGNGRVREVGTDGTIRTVVARASSRFSRCCYNPQEVAADRRGNLYIVDGTTGPVWLMNRGQVPITIHGRTVRPGTLEALTGSPLLGVGGEGSPAAETAFRGLSAIALDQKLNLYAVDGEEHTVRKIDRSGTISTVVGVGTLGFNGDGLKGPLTALERPVDLAVDRCGNLLIADFGNQRIRKLGSEGECPTAERAAPRFDPEPRVGQRALLVLAGLFLGVALAVWFFRRKRSA